MAVQISIDEDSGVAHARREATHLARHYGLDETDCGRVGIVATELARNLVKHAGGGHLLLSTNEEDGVRGIDVISIDRGPGFKDLNASLQDGYSTAGTPGNGMGAIRRQSEVFDVASWQGNGAAVFARVNAGAVAPAQHKLQIGGLWLPKPGETACGDALAFRRQGEAIDLFLADGLGHGQDAARASSEAVRIFCKTMQGPEGVVDAVHRGLRHTRGAAIALASLDPENNGVLYAGLGNIAGMVIGAHETKRMVSQNGTAGLAGRTPRAFSYALPRPFLLVMHSDGLASSWSLERYPGLMAAHPVLICAVLLRDLMRGRDDASVAVISGRAP